MTDDGSGPHIPWAVGVSEDFQAVTLIIAGNGTVTKGRFSPSVARAISTMLEAAADWVDPEEDAGEAKP